MLFVGQSQMVLGGMKMEIENKVSGKKNLVTSNELKVVAASSYDGRLVHAAVRVHLRRWRALDAESNFVCHRCAARGVRSSRNS